MPNEIEELKYRLRKALDYRNMKPVELSNKTGIPKSAISQYMSGYAKPKDDRVYLISKVLDINEGWLLGFNVPMEKHSRPDLIIHDTKKGTSSVIEFKKSSHMNDRLLQGIINYLGLLNIRGQEEALKRIKELVFIPAYTEEEPNNMELNAAHSIEGATQEDKDHDDDVMKNF